MYNIIFYLRIVKNLGFYSRLIKGKSIIKPKITYSYFPNY